MRPQAEATNLLCENATDPTTAAVWRNIVLAHAELLDYANRYLVRVVRQSLHCTQNPIRTVDMVPRLEHLGHPPPPCVFVFVMLVGGGLGLRARRRLLLLRTRLRQSWIADWVPTPG